MTRRRVVFDTSAVIGLVERRDPALVASATELGGPMVRSLAVHGELRHGVASAVAEVRAMRARTLERYEQLSSWPDDELDLDDLASLYGTVAAVSADPGLTAGANDRWVIVDCLALSADLVTSDGRQAELARATADRLGRALAVDVVG